MCGIFIVTLDSYQVTYYGVVNSWRDTSRYAGLMSKGCKSRKSSIGLAVKSLRL